jgi:hypothetical protein
LQKKKTGLLSLDFDLSGDSVIKKPPWVFPRLLLNFRSNYFFFALRFSSMAAWAAARRATGTRYGEQLT